MDSTTTATRKPTLTPGSRSCQCAVCGEFCNSVAAFDKHRTGPVTRRRCLTRIEMLADGMSVNERGFWIGSVYDRPAA